MGRTFSSEIANLQETYAWVCSQSIENLSRSMGLCAGFPLVTVGSGGSLSVADYACGLHKEVAGKLATPITPLEIHRRLRAKSDSACLFLTASGNNRDVVSALRVAAVSEPARLLALCMKTGSKVASLSERYNYIDLVEFDNPAGKDGFLATNSLLAMCALLYRAYADLSPSHSPSLLPRLPKTYRQFMGLSGKSCIAAEKRKAKYTPLWARDHLVVLFGPSTSAAALDLESKFTEAALGTVQLADYRNFAHGRHHWLARRASETSVLALVSQEDLELAERTLGLLPNDVVQLKVVIEAQGPLAGLSALNEALYIVASAGEARGIDPGRPGVPPFGRKLYHLSVGRAPTSPATTELPAREAIAISRKISSDSSLLSQKRELQAWRDAYRAFCERLRRARFRALILDYDGTLCSDKERFSGIGSEACGRLTDLLDAGLLLGIATGRGDSASKDLRAKLPSRAWPQVVLGYHGGAEIGSLADETVPKSQRPDPALNSLRAILRQDFRTEQLLDEQKLSGRQLSLRLKKGVSVSHVYDLIVQTLRERGASDLAVWRSAHSVDVQAASVSKLAMYEKLREILGQNGERADQGILCIGDEGRFPGNDTELLSTPLSLSVDQASSSPDTCWNLAPPGVRGVRALMSYLKRIERCSGDVFRIAVPITGKT